MIRGYPFGRRCVAGTARGLRAACALGLAAAPAAAAEQTFPVPVATIYTGDVIKPTMLRDQTYPENFKPRMPAVETAARAVGKVAKRTLLPGEVIPSGALDEVKLVTRGSPTVIVFEERGMVISTLGTALANATVNEPVTVRNTATGRLIQGVVQPDGRVKTGGQP
ncbi:flagellar basal body P-ring formation protein FlgA [Methylobacterium sp. WL18]|uniref:flagellar basal body P-ring formation chaperone FlgA n=1 Tax=Methylobacterium sp. WL18 TaxID=2603897 RepID=UPI0011CCCBA6|nr:flagellar basal body P-ring formation chaperone FlgA [Methylobacterium sp. WL18]TXN72209.1 flagellar basal body P-ring formation protein FlgA [Methylobacterium sp. WL18]